MVIKIKQIVGYNGHSLSANGTVNFNLNAQYSQLTETIKLMQLLNNDVNIKAKVSGKVIKLGIFRVKQITIDGDGESKLKFNGLSDYVELDNLNNLPLHTDDCPEFQVLFESDIEE
nr:MAG TPA: hypothetical protein [Caudoviricetes sp.]